MFASIITTTPVSAGTGDNYPEPWRSAPMNTYVDSWGYYSRNCTSWTAWALHDRNGFEMPRAIGNASNWGPWASSHGYAVNMTPAVGSVAWWSSNHVAWVEAVNGDQVTIEEYNYGFTGNYKRRTIARTSVSGYIHFKDITAPPTLPADADGDGSSDGSDLLPSLAGPPNNRGVPLQSTRSTGDFNGDGKQDAMEIYDYGNAQTKFLVHYGDGVGGFAWPQVAWDSGPGNWEWNLLKPVIGDFNKDGKSDIAVFYDYGNGRVVLWELFGTTTGLSTPSIRWDSGPGMWEWHRIVPLAGDFNGDGNMDIMHAYDYNNAQTKFLAFYGDGAGNFAAPQVAWDSGPGNWQWKLLKHVVGDFNEDGKSDVAVFYDYGNNRVVLWELLGSSGGLLVGGIKWDSGPGMWQWNNFVPLVGDFNGDSNLDIVQIYDYTNARTKFLVHYGDGVGGFAWPQVAWDSGPGNWEWKRLKPVVGDLNSDGKTDIAVFYDYSNAQVKLWEMLGSSTGFTVGGIKWDSGPGMWEWHRILIP